MTLYANNQSPFINRDTTAAVLGLPQSKVRVIQPPVGGAFGGKDDVLYQTSGQVARLALLTGRPVRLVFTRPESMAASYKRQATQVHLKLGADGEGTLQAAKVEMLADSGAYASMTPMAMWRATMHGAGAYRYQAVHVDMEAVYTNNGYSGAFRGFGNVAAAAAVEMAIDELACKLGRDPLAFRLQNCLRQGDRTMTGDRHRARGGIDGLPGVGAPEVRLGPQACGVCGAGGRCARGGVESVWPCYFHGCGLGGEGTDFAVTTLKIEEDYSITLTSRLTDYGQGSRTVFTLLAAEVLGVSMERIRVLRPDTHTAIDSGPTVASRASIVGGQCHAGGIAETRRAADAGGRQDTALFARSDRPRWRAVHRPQRGAADLRGGGRCRAGPGAAALRRGALADPHDRMGFRAGAGEALLLLRLRRAGRRGEVTLRTGKVRVVNSGRRTTRARSSIPRGRWDNCAVASRRGWATD